MKDISAVVLVGGEGTRLRPLTLHTPKALVPVVNKPLLSYIIEWFKYQRIYNLNFSICYQPDKLKSAFGSGAKYGVNINYFSEKEPLGTGGAIKNTEKFFKNTTVVMNGDVLTDLDLVSMLKYHRSKNSKITIFLTN